MPDESIWDQKQGPKPQPGPNDQTEAAAEFIQSLSPEEQDQFAADLGTQVAGLNPQPVDEAVEIPDLIRASDLPGGEMPEPAELGLEPGGRYKGFLILPDLPIQDPAHEWLFSPEGAARGRQPFYVLHQKGDGTDAHRDVVGLVPWLGSTIIWPWEKAWEQDLYHEKQTPERQAIMQAFVKSKKEKA